MKKNINNLKNLDDKTKKAMCDAIDKCKNVTNPDECERMGDFVKCMEEYHKANSN